LFAREGTLKHLLKMSARALYYNVDRRTTTLHTSYGQTALFELRVQLSRLALPSGLFRQVGELPTRPFVYFPLHVDPEASTMVLAPDHTDQLAVIESLAKRLPFGMSLVVKERVRMLGRRPRGFYETIRRFPSVSLASPLESTFQLIQRSTFVAAITGTAA